MFPAKKMLRRLVGRRYAALRRLGGFLKWSLPALTALSRDGRSSDRRLLVIYDTSSQPFSIGDILIIQEGSLALREKHSLGFVDFALVYDPKHPASADATFSSITEDNAVYHLASILPVAQVNQHLGSLLLFNSHRQLERFIADNADRYEIWPSAWRYAGRDYLYYAVFNELLYEHYRRHGSIPHLTCRPFLREWAAAFYRTHVVPQVPVTVNVRNNPAFHQHRNLNLDCWMEFFDYCEKRYPAKFVVICARSEIDDRLRARPNVLIAKDHHTSIEQDLALIHASAIHMGAGSGPVSMAWFHDRPYLMVNTVYGPGYFAHAEMIIQEEPDIQRFWFSGPLQRIAGGPETTELLIAEFERMWASVDLGALDRSTAEVIDRPAEMRTWLR
jgi:hypothetical protein